MRIKQKIDGKFFKIILKKILFFQNCNWKNYENLKIIFFLISNEDFGMNES